MSFEKKVPEWKNSGAEPSTNLKNTGFVGGYKPPASVFNWFWHSVSEALKELQGITPQKIGAVNKAGDTMQGVLAVPKIIANGHSGIEGGQIELAPPLEGSDLGTENICIDIYKNQFRIFGANFGINLDLTECKSTKFYHTGFKPTPEELGAADAENHKVKTYTNFNQLGVTDVSTLTSWVNIIPDNSMLSTSVYYAIAEPLYKNGLIPAKAAGGLQIANVGSRCTALFITDIGEVYTGGSENLNGKTITWKKPLLVTGGTMTGKIISAIDGPILGRSDNKGALRIDGGTNFDKGAFLALHGNEADKAGAFQLVATTGEAARKELVGYPDGTLQWAGGKIYGEHNKPTPANIGAEPAITALPISKGGTGNTNAAAAFSALSKCTNNGNWKTAQTGISFWNYEGADKDEFGIPSTTCMVFVLKYSDSRGVAIAMNWARTNFATYRSNLHDDTHNNLWTEWKEMLTADSKVSADDITAGTLGGKVRANATHTATVGDSQVRNINAGTTDLTAETSALETGALYFVYE